MPMIALSVVLLFRKPRRPRAIGCALAGLALISQLREAIDGIARMMSIAPDDHAMKLAMFRTIFNVLGVTLMLLLLDLLIGFLIRSIPRTRPRYQSPSLSVRGRGRVPQIFEIALRKEVAHPYEPALELILRGLNLHRDQAFLTRDLPDWCGNAGPRSKLISMKPVAGASEPSMRGSSKSPRASAISAWIRTLPNASVRCAMPPAPSFRWRSRSSICARTSCAIPWVLGA